LTLQRVKIKDDLPQQNQRGRRLVIFARGRGRRSREGFGERKRERIIY